MDKNITDLKEQYHLAREKYAEGNPIMSDEEYDKLESEIRELIENEEEDFTRETGYALKENQVILEIPMPSFDKPKDKASLDRWLEKMNCEKFLITAKLDGISSQWNPKKRTLCSHGDGLIGNNISIYVDSVQGLITTPENYIIRGEIMTKKNSSISLASSHPRNAVSGIMNPSGKFKEESIEKAKEIEFIAYEIIEPRDISPIKQFEILVQCGFKVPYHTILDRSQVKPESLTEIFDFIEASQETNHFVYDGVVVYPEIARPPDYKYKLRSNDKIDYLRDRIGWKQRKNKMIYERTVSSVLWPNNKETKVLVPVVKFSPDILYHTEGSEKDKHYNTVTLHNASYIRDNGIGEGAIIRISIAGDCIPKYEGTKEPVEPSFPDINYEWDEQKIKIYAVEETREQKIDALKKSLDALGVDGIGLKTIEKFYNKGFETLEKIYSAKWEDFLDLDGVADTSAQNIYKGLRSKQANWSIINLMIASRCFPQGVGDTKLNLIFEISKDWRNWDYEKMKNNCPKGLPPKTLETLLKCVDKFKKFYDSFTNVVGEPVKRVTSEAAKSTASPSGRVIVFTGTTAKTLGIENKLLAQGDLVEDNITKKTTHLVYSGVLKESSKSKKAKEMGIHIIEVKNL